MARSDRLPPTPAPELGAPRLVETPNGRKLFCQELPGDSPTIVFESGMASSRSLWVQVVQGLGDDRHAVVYDRAGLGRSPEATGPRRLLNLADDLNGLLDELGPGPFVLVGHSWGGPIVRAAAALRPERLAAMVLVDPADEECDLYYAPSMKLMNDVQGALFPALSRTGLLGALFVGSVKALPARVRADLRREMYTPKAVRAQVAEAQHLADDLRAMRRVHVDPEQVPTTIISGTRPDIGKKGRANLIEAHRRRAEGFQWGRHVLAEQSGHLVMIDEPEAVAAEILRLIGH